MSCGHDRMCGMGSLGTRMHMMVHSTRGSVTGDAHALNRGVWLCPQISVHSEAVSCEAANARVYSHLRSMIHVVRGTRRADLTSSLIPHSTP